MIKKQLYIIPETEVLEVRFEENILSGFNAKNHTQYITGDDDYEEL